MASQALKDAVLAARKGLVSAQQSYESALAAVDAAARARLTAEAGLNTAAAGYEAARATYLAEVEADLNAEAAAIMVAELAPEKPPDESAPP